MEGGGDRSLPLRIGAIAASVVLGMIAAYELGGTGGSILALIVPLVLAVFVIVALVVLRPDARTRSADEAGRHRFDLELERSRRHERPLAILRISMARDQSERRRGWVDVPAVREAVRAVDAVWADGRHVFVLMPEADRVALARAINRILAHLPGVGTDAMRTAVYPDDGLTSGALLEWLEAPLAEPRPADIVQLAPATAEVEQESRLG